MYLVIVQIMREKIDTSLFELEPYLINFYIERNLYEDIDLKNQFTKEKLPGPMSIREAASKNYVDYLFNYPNRLKKNNTYVDFDVQSFVKIVL